MIKSILDTDLYKFTTSYAYMKLFPYAKGTFEFFDRDNTEYTEEFLQSLKLELYNLQAVQLTEKEKEFMTNNCRFIPPMYWEWLSGIRLEADKGMDLKYQVGFMRMLNNLNKKCGAKSLVVSHHSLPLLLADKLYWFESRTSVPSQVYLSIMTGYEFTPPKRMEDE